MEELEFYPRNVQSENKDRMNKSERVASLTDISYLNKPLFGPKLVFSKMSSDFRRGFRSPNEAKERRGEDGGVRSRHFRSNERPEPPRKAASHQEMEPVIRAFACPKNSPNLLKQWSKPSFKVLKANATFSGPSGDFSKSLSHQLSNHSAHFQTQGSNRASNGRVPKDALFHEIVKKTAQIVASPFLKTRRTGDGSPKAGRSAEKSRREEHKSLTQKAAEDKADWRRSNFN